MVCDAGGVGSAAVRDRDSPAACLVNINFINDFDILFGGVMESIGALKRISEFLLGKAKSTFGLFSSTVISCLTVNISASDQYLAIVIPGKMFSNAYNDRKLSTLV